MFQQNITSPTILLSGYLQRLSATLGLNSSPTTFEFDLVTENDQAFDFNSAYPGKLLSFTLGSLKFGGIIQGWTENFGQNGKTYSVRAADPRFLFGNIPLNLNGQGLSTGIALDNYFNVFRYYGSPQEADCTKDGMTFSKIRNFLSTTGIINAYGNKFLLQFSSGFMDSSGSVNPSGIPYWYRINASEISLEQLLQQVSQDFGMDYYAEVDYTNFNPTGTLNTLYIKHIYRNTLSDPSEISGFVVNARNSGVLTSYKRGQELRTDPTTSIALGPSVEYWGFPQSTDIQCYWGKTSDGTAITKSTSFLSGVILLDHITGSGSQWINSTISLPTVTISKTPQGVYPPRLIKAATTITVSGYYASSNVMRAALFNQESWEEVLTSEQPVFASGLGMQRERFLRANDFAVTNSGIRNSIAMTVLGYQITDRDPLREEVVRAVYDATRRTAEQYWGKSWLLTVDSSTWYNNGDYDSSELVPRLEFEASDSAWSEPGRSLPSGVTLNHAVLSSTNNPVFRDEVGKIKSFLSIPNFRTQVDNTNFPYPVDLSNYERENFLVEQNSKLVVPVSLEKYDKNPTQFIANLSFPIEGVTSGTIYKGNKYYYDFLKYAGFTNQNIKDYNMLQNIDENLKYGLASPRLFAPPYSSDIYGFFIALRRTEKNFGGFIASGIRCGGIRIIQDSSLAPWTYGGVSGFNTAGTTLVNRSIADSTVIDSADLNIAGLPPFNLADSVATSSQITSASCQFGPDGFSTNYSIRTFAVPANKLSKVLFDKITNIYTGFARQGKEIEKLQGIPPIEKAITPERIQKLYEEASREGSYIGGIVIPSISGIYEPNRNPIP